LRSVEPDGLRVGSTDNDSKPFARFRPIFARQQGSECRRTARLGDDAQPIPQCALRASCVMVRNQNRLRDIRLCDGKHEFSHTLRSQGISSDAIGRRINRPPCLQSTRQRRGALWLHCHDPDPPFEPGGDAADQSAAAHGNQKRRDARKVALRLGPQRSLSQESLGLVEGMDGQRVPFLDEPLAGRKRIGIAFPSDYQIGPVASNALALRR
jgi:hypothetical protein